MTRQPFCMTSLPCRRKKGPREKGAGPFSRHLALRLRYRLLSLKVGVAEEAAGPLIFRADEGCPTVCYSRLPRTRAYCTFTISLPPIFFLELGAFLRGKKTTSQNTCFRFLFFRPPCNNPKVSPCRIFHSPSHIGGSDSSRNSARCLAVLIFIIVSLVFFTNLLNPR